MEHLSGIDDFWLRVERPENLLTITAVVQFAGRLTEQALKAKFGDELLRFRRFRQRVVAQGQLFPQPSWEDDPHFSLGRHVHSRELPRGDEAGLRRLLDEMLCEPLDHAKPLWEVHLVEGVRPGTTLIARVHHCLADGFSLIRLMLRLIDKDCQVQLPGKVALPPLGLDLRQEDSGGRFRAAREFAQRLVDGGLRMLRHPVPETGPLRDAAQCAAHLLTMTPDAPSLLRGTLGPRKRAAWSDRFSVQQLKEAAHAFGGTINDLLLGTLAGAFRRYLQARGEVADGLGLRAIVPVNIRPMDIRTDELGNGFGLVFLDLPVGSPTLKGRLDALKARMDALKESPEAFVTFGLMQAVGLLPAVLQEQFVKLFDGKATAVVTNMPGPMDKVRIAGQTVDDMLFFVPQSASTGVGVSIFSYAGSVRMGVAADAGLLPDPGALVVAQKEEMAALGLTPLSGP